MSSLPLPRPEIAVILGLVRAVAPPPALDVADEAAIPMTPSRPHTRVDADGPRRDAGLSPGARGAASEALALAVPHTVTSVRRPG